MPDVIPSTVVTDDSSATATRTDALLSGNGKANPGARVDYADFLDCIHCGLCTSACPTYVLTGNENDGPRGRIYLMRAVTDQRIPLNDEVRKHLDLCLDCRACETACPSGVQYGRLIEPFRVGMHELANAQAKSPDWFHRYVLMGLLPYPRRLAWALWPARIAQRLGLLWMAEKLGLLRLLPHNLRQLTQSLPPRGRKLPRLPEVLPAIGKRRARVALFTGCVNEALFAQTNWATARVLQQNGCDVLIPREQVCCGAIALHAGESEPARHFANANAAIFQPADVDAVIVNVAGCGAMLKDYPHHWHDAHDQTRAAFAEKVRDVQEFLDQLGPYQPEGELPLTVTYHDACHLVHAQKIREAPRRLLRLIPGLTLVDLPESELCCGAAGTYNLTQPEMSAQLSRRKLGNILGTGARIVATANAGCLLQIAREARLDGNKLTVIHPIELLDLSYRQIPWEKRY
ncbi:MAG: heterodisulfide reductase-related iron-sulfur binding cluster [Pirellulales bacterium]|nr:heterodisulfide reductase-related iron-sulfur binding cluster [Pirellulales bacterium]